jgi:aqualysin 1
VKRAHLIALVPLIPLLLAACENSPQPLAAENPSSNAVGGDPRGVIPGRFIVTVHPAVDPAAVARGYGIAPQYTYRHALNGFAGSISDVARQGLMRDSRVLRIEPDAWVHLAETTQEDAAWALDRIDQRYRPLDQRYTYLYGGEGVTAYVIDSGIRFSHNEFGGRAHLGYDFAIETEPEDNLHPEQGPGEDCHGHGTTVAGVLGGATFGVAKNVSLVSVRLSGCKGSFPMSRVVAAVDWVTANAVQPAIANLSLAYSGDSTALDDAVRNMIASGVATTAAAGNAGRENGACEISPARVREAMTIGSSTVMDDRSTFSNYGGCVDWYAPGTNVTSATWTDDDATRTVSGTSISAPITAGVAALYLEAHPAAAPSRVFDALRQATTKDALVLGYEVHRSGRTTGVHYGELLYSRFDSVGEDPPSDEKPCRGNKCE